MAGKGSSLLMSFVLLGLVSQSFIAPISARKLEEFSDKKSYYSPSTPHHSNKPSPPTATYGGHTTPTPTPKYGSPTPSGGSYTPPSGGSYTPPSGGSYTPPSGGSHTPPSGGSYTPPSGGNHTPPSGCSYTPPSGRSHTPPSGGSYTPPSGGSHTPPSGGSYTPPSGGSHTPPSGGSHTPPSGGSYTPPSGGSHTPPSGGSHTPPSGGSHTPPTTTPSTHIPSTGTCDYWKKNPDLIKSLIGYWGTVSQFFGPACSVVFGGNPSLIDALGNKRTDGVGALFREGTAAFLNSIASKSYPFSTPQVKNSFAVAIISDGAAAAQAELFKRANEGKFKL